MARVAPATKGLASRDVVCRDLTVEITKAAELAQTRTTSFCTWTTSLLRSSPSACLAALGLPRSWYFGM